MPYLFLFLTSYSAPATAASRTSRSPQFFAVAKWAPSKNRFPRSPASPVATRSLTPRGYGAASFRQIERRHIMSDIDHLTLFTQFCGFKIVVLANRLGCDNGLARIAHDRLIARLGDLINLMRDALAAERNLLLDESSQQNRNAAEDLYWIAEEYAHRWLSDRLVPLLDDLTIDLATREVFDAHARRWRPLEDGGPWLRNVRDAELCGLRRIIDEIAAETGVSFSACRIVYDASDGVTL
ncbi:hypothetical protein [Bradyrhizobium liaoningense]